MGYNKFPGEDSTKQKCAVCEKEFNLEELLSLKHLKLCDKCYSNEINAGWKDSSKRNQAKRFRY